jgi:hypothetical protein
MQNSVFDSLLQDYMDLLPTDGVPIIDSSTNHFMERGNPENQLAS